MTKNFFKKIIAQSTKDLQMISALCADGSIKISNMKYLPKNKIFFFLITRKEKENNEDLKNTIIKFSFIDDCKSKNIDPNNFEKNFKLIGIEALKKDHDYKITLLLSENSSISLQSEIIDVEMCDQQE